MEDERLVSVSLLDQISGIAAEEWDSCAAPEAIGGARAAQPFLTHRFLSAFEESGSVHWRTGWAPKHLVARDDAGALVGVMPLYVKGHSQGEYVFDHGWANAFERAGGSYFPKLLSAIPFTPVTARKMLEAPGIPASMAQGALLSAVAEIAVENRISSVHANFCTQDEIPAFEAAGFLPREGQQFHWENRAYEDFDGFLDSLASRKRKAIRKERAKAVEAVSIRTFTGDAITPELWDAFWVFYQDTGARKWGTPYLTREFFEIAQSGLRDDLLLVLAEREGRWVAGALNVIAQDALYGRYWGCTEDHPCLHFELCYYQAIDYAIAHGLSRVEAGAQGEHKLARGYVPTRTWSAHFIVDAGFREAVSRFLEQERALVAEDIAILDAHTPFRRGGG